MSPSKMMSRTGRVLCGVTHPLPVSDKATAVSRCESLSHQKTITMQNLNPNIIKLQYAVRGPLVIRAAAIRKELAEVMTEMGPPCSKLEMASFMSASKGYTGECGLRGGWMELMNLDKEVQFNMYKTISTMLCSNSMGQCTIDLVAKPPQCGEPSYELWREEKMAVLASLTARANMIVETLNNMEGFKCNVVQGAMYAFPRIELPPKAIEAAKAEGKVADVFYAFKLLEETGICIVPGSGFGQRPGTFHFRTTILPQPKVLEKMLEIFKTFHVKFTEEYS